MGIINRLTSARPSDEAEPRATRPDRFDPFLGDSELRNAYRAPTEGEWGRLEQFLSGSSKRWLFTTIITSPLVGRCSSYRVGASVST